PALHMYPGLDVTAIHHAEEMGFFTGSNFFGIVYPLIIGAAAFLIFTKWDLYRFKLPARYGIDNIYTQTALALLRAREYSTVLYSKFTAWLLPQCKASWSYTFGLYIKMRDGYRRGVDGLTAFIRGIPGMIREIPGYERAQTMSLDIAFGVMVIAFAAAALALTLL
ncbi:MAG: hypothetical protein JXA49_10880, partial [Actinobacteria bacterium]|nr:hypothetical protein [Actinomycetota bacterium]